jgi:hypothetical protein
LDRTSQEEGLAPALSLEFLRTWVCLVSVATIQGLNAATLAGLRNAVPPTLALLSEATLNATARSAVTQIVETPSAAIQIVVTRNAVIHDVVPSAATLTVVTRTLATRNAAIPDAALSAATLIVVTPAAATLIAFRVVIRVAPISAPIVVQTAVVIPALHVHDAPHEGARVAAL